MFIEPLTRDLQAQVTLPIFKFRDSKTIEAPIVKSSCESFDGSLVFFKNFRLAALSFISICE